MIVLTVKTLDSQNHTFTVDDDITVVEFKAKIADTVNIPADTQRIIYCGRVLQDEAKLSDYDVNGKVVHLVQRAPPTANAQPSNRSSSPLPHRRGYRTFDGGNTMYLGSMAFPSNLMESQGIVPPPPTHSLAGSRLNVARRMLRRAETVINLLENPTSRQNEQSNNDEQPEEEVTPIIEARVIVPSGAEDHIDDAMVLSAVQNTLFSSTNNSIPVSAEVTLESSPASHSPTGTPPAEPSASTTPEEGVPPSGEANASENWGEAASSSETRSGGVNARSLTENASRTTEMAELLQTLSQLQDRFAPFLERYRCFMIEDPVIPTENVRQTQLMLTRVSEVLHFLGHAYHSLSDIIIRVRTPPPRPLLCRPILIQHSAVVQAGIPIQVEVAQFNLSAERPAAASSNANTPSSTEQAGTTTTAAPASTTSNSSDTTRSTTEAPAPSAPPPPSNGSLPPNVQQINIHSFSNNFPFVPTASMRMQSFPIDLRSALRSNSSSASSSPRTAANNNNNASNGATENAAGTGTAAAPAPANPATAAATAASGTATTTSSSTAQPSMGGFFGPPGANGNPSVEFFMEVSPDVLRGSMVNPPTNFMQSLMQIAGQIMTQQVNTTSTGSSTATSTTTTSASTAQTGDAAQNSTTQGQNNAAVPGQNSQARGNTQTNPTTATHTRSTPRPHVHLAQQAMQGGFDPFLPCNSHHVTHRRRGHVHHFHPSAAPNAASSSTTTPPASTATSTPNNGTPTDTPTASSSPRSGATRRGGAQGPQSLSLQNLLEEIYQSLRMAYTRRRNSEPTVGATGAATAAASSGQTPNQSTGGAPNAPTNLASGSVSNAGTNADGTSAERIPPPLNQVSNLLAMIRGSASVTVADFLQNIPPDDTSSGESIITDLVMLVTRQLTVLDMLSITSGNYESFINIYGDMQAFVESRILGGPNIPENVNRGVERLMEELQPFFEAFSLLRTRDNINIVQSIQQLFRRRLPEIITGLSSINENNVRTLVNNCMDLIKLIVALAIHASATGQAGVEDTFQTIIHNYLHGIPADMHSFTTMTSFNNLHYYMTNNPFGEADLRQYIVRNSEVAQPELERQSEAVRIQHPEAPREVEAMEVDDPQSIIIIEDGNEANEPPLSFGDVDEPLPNVVIGAEAWHSQVPEDWVPIITRDVQRQRRQPSQRPHSDAYLSGMPSKKRKIVNNTKPQGSLPQVISDSVRRAVSTTGLSNAAPLEVVAQAAGDSNDLQTAYRNLLRTSVQSALQNNEDFTPERFPNASAYFKSPK